MKNKFAGIISGLILFISVGTGSVLADSVDEIEKIFAEGFQKFGYQESASGKEDNDDRIDKFLMEKYKQNSLCTVPLKAFDDYYIKGLERCKLGKCRMFAGYMHVKFDLLGIENYIIRLIGDDNNIHVANLWKNPRDGKFYYADLATACAIKKDDRFKDVIQNIEAIKKSYLFWDFYEFAKQNKIRCTDNWCTYTPKYGSSDTNLSVGGSKDISSLEGLSEEIKLCFNLITTGVIKNIPGSPVEILLLVRHK